MIELKTISNFLNELYETIEEKAKHLLNIDSETQKDLAFSAVEKIIEHIDELVKNKHIDDKKEIYKFLARKNNRELALNFAEILTISEIIALYFLRSYNLMIVMDYYCECLNYKIEKLT
jgi:signal recognition particle GTPase